MADAPPDPESETEELDTEETEEVETETEAEGDEPDAEAEEETEQETEAEPEGEAEAEETEQEAPPPRSSRGSRQFGEMRRELRETRRQLDELKRQRPAADPAARAEAERQAREAEEAVLLTGDAGKIGKFYSDRAAQQIRSEVGAIAGHLADQADKTAFTTLANANSVYAAVADEVEERLANARAQGMNPQRIAIAHVLLGEKVAKRAGAARTRATKRAAVNNDRQRGRPGGGGRSDATTGRRPSGDTHAKRGSRLDESGML